MIDPWKQELTWAEVVEFIRTQPIEEIRAKLDEARERLRFDPGAARARLADLRNEIEELKDEH
jgi:hypothetical protein